MRSPGSHTAAWLTDATAEALAGGGQLRQALRSYRRAHRFIDKYDALGRKEALAKPPDALQRAVRTAAVSDPCIARRLAMFACGQRSLRSCSTPG
ncbi:hypothetical protein [Streptomyces afghaniensis]|uniref:hypothetical protein n=1 Tax=Streptomyces afghaniensis TaxID=66865 RepID=UPI0037BB5A9E